MVGTASEVAWEIIRQKMKYAQKVLSEDALEQNIYTFYDLLDLLSFSFSFNIFDTLFSSLLSSILFSIPLSDVVPVAMDFKLELPTTDEFLKGLLIKIVPTDLSEVFPELLSLSTLYYGIFEPEIARELLGVQVEKGVFGKSRYDNAYYDPPAVREFLRSTLYALTKKRSSDETVRARVEAIARSLNVNIDLSAYIFNMLQMNTYGKVTACSVDYCWFDVSRIPKEGSGAMVTFVGWDLKPYEADYLCVTDSSGSCWFDNCLFDVSVFSPDQVPTMYIEERAGNLLTDVAMYMYQRVRSRILATPFALANYQTAEERMKPETSPRIETYGLNRFLVEDIRMHIKSIIDRRVPHQFLQNLYVDAALDLVKRISKPGGWGDEAFRAMSRDELLSYFLDKWGSQGLDRSVLEEIFRYIYDTGILNRYVYIRSQTDYISKASRGGI